MRDQRIENIARRRWDLGIQAISLGCRLTFQISPKLSSSSTRKKQSRPFHGVVTLPSAVSVESTLNIEYQAPLTRFSTDTDTAQEVYLQLQDRSEPVDKSKRHWLIPLRCLVILDQRVSPGLCRKLEK